MVRMGHDDKSCYRCERDDVELSYHTVHFESGGRDSRYLCPTCVRRIQQSDNDVRSVT